MKMSKELSVINSYNDLAQVAEAMVKSGYFEDSKSVSQAIVKIMAGRELGLGQFASMTGIHIIKGKPSLGANLIGSLIKNDPRYDYRVTQLTDDVCQIVFFEGEEQIGVSTFTKADATKAGTQNMNKFPRNMLFARAISNGAKWYTPGIFGGAPVYTPEELGADVDEDGNIVTVEVTVEDPTPEPAPKKKNGNERPWLPKKLNEMLAKKANTYSLDHKVDERARQQFAAALDQLTAGKRKPVQVALGLLESTKESEQTYLQACIDWLGSSWNADAQEYTCEEMTFSELALVVAGLE